MGGFDTSSTDYMSIEGGPQQLGLFHEELPRGPPFMINKTSMGYLFISLPGHSPTDSFVMTTIRIYGIYADRERCVVDGYEGLVPCNVLLTIG